MNNSKIREIKAREILDSRGIPTLEVKLKTDLGEFMSSVPSGSSKGKYEALELRDGGKRYEGKGVLLAVKNVNEIIAPKLKGKDFSEQKRIDNFLIKLDATENKSRLGANAILAVSMAACRAGAAFKNLSLWKWLSKISNNKAILPTPLVLLLEAGVHGKGEPSFQEFSIASSFNSFKKNFSAGQKIREVLGFSFNKKYQKLNKGIGLEGAFIPPIKKTEKTLDFLWRAVKEAGFENKSKIVIDAASSTFFKKGKYFFEKKIFGREKLLEFYSNLIAKYSISGLEDPFSEEDWGSWKMLIELKIRNFLVIGDDLTATNQKRIKEAKEKNACNAVVIKPNQIGTITETIEAANLAKSFGWKIIVSHRAGETKDNFIADLAVGLGADFIKAGAPGPKERMAKYNRLLEIETEINKKR